MYSLCDYKLKPIILVDSRSYSFTCTLDRKSASYAQLAYMYLCARTDGSIYACVNNPYAMSFCRAARVTHERVIIPVMVSETL